MSEGLIERIKAHEGYRRFAYECSEGRLTIGYGTMIENGGHGIPEPIAEALLADYINVIYTQMSKRLWFTDLNQARQECIVEMCYQIGVEGVAGFRNMISSLKAENWLAAADDALDSLWAEQTPARAAEVAGRLAQG
jgi:lysozyme